MEIDEIILLYDQIKLLKSFHSGNRLNDSGESEAAVKARTRVEWIKFRECGEVAE